MADFGETRESLRRAEGSFRRSGEHGTEENVVCPGRGRALGGFQRVARDANLKVRRNIPGGLIGAEQTLRFLDRQGIATQMDAASLFGKSHVQAVIYKNARCGERLIWSFQGAAYCSVCEQGSISARQILLAKLNPINARGDGQSDLFQNWFKQASLGRGAQAAAIGDVADDGPSTRLAREIERRIIGAGHERDQDESR